MSFNILDVVNMSDIADPVQVTKTQKKTAKPRMFNVIFLNDDYTPMPFVLEVLMEIFEKTTSEAVAITLEIHHGDQGIVGTYTREIAEQKAEDTITVARQQDYPLKVKTSPAPTA